jgi:tetratricopeptide (TPR) repeat protein
LIAVNTALGYSPGYAAMSRFPLSTGRIGERLGHTRTAVDVPGSEQSPIDDLAHELRLLKDRAGLSLSRLAARCWCSKSALERYLNGKVFPPRDTVTALSNACGGDIPALMALWERAWTARGGMRRGTSPTTTEVATLQCPVAPLTPAQLPPDIRGFTGRSAELARLEFLLTELDTGTGADSIPFIAITGSAGVGKTALAIHFGRRVAERFPDGQLYIDLRGHAAVPPVAAAEALGRMLRSLGVPPERIPPDEQERAALYRSVLAGKRVLVMLDDAHSAAQVTPLLPVGPRSLVVVTSRGTLATLDGATHVHLDVLSQQDALALLARFAGAGRVAAELVSAAKLVVLCSRLPLAVRIAAARLAARPAWTITTLVDRLTDETRRLDEFGIGGLTVRTSFAVSYHALTTSADPIDQRAARMFRLLGVLEWVQLSVPVAAALVGETQSDAAAALERLLDARLLDSTRPGLYHAHDLLHLYAREQASREELAADRQAALHRALDCYLAAAERVTLLIDPQAASHVGAEPTPSPQGGFDLSGLADTIGWTDAEHTNLVAAVKQAVATPGAADRAVRLTAALYWPLETRAHWQDLVTLRELAAQVARRLGDRPAEALAHEDLAWVSVMRGRADAAVVAGRRALALWRELGNYRGKASSLIWLGHAYRSQGRHDDVITSYQKALAIARDLGDRGLKARALNALGLEHQRLRHLDEAITHHRHALTLFHTLANRTGTVSALGNLGWAHHRAGRHQAAVTYQRLALALATTTGHRYQQAESLWALGQTHHALGNHDNARTNWRKSITILHDVGALSNDQADALHRQPVPQTPEIIQYNT